MSRDVGGGRGGRLVHLRQPSWSGPRRGRTFVVTDKGSSVGSAGTMNELIAAIGEIRRPVVDDHLRRHDLSRWLADVFGDHLLASEIRRLEDRHRVASIVDIRESIIKANSTRYEIDDPSGLEAHASSPM